MTLPVAEYAHDLGCAVIGGVVIRYPAQPGLDGSYLFADACSGNIWLIDADGSGRQEPPLAGRTDRAFSAIALGEDGTILATDRGSGALVRLSGGE